jgi:hypothetical protein
MGQWVETAGVRDGYEQSGGRSIGFEFEANWPAEAMYEWYRHNVIVKNDGSLRGYSAAEVITPTPTPLDQFNYEPWLRKTPVNQGIGCIRNGMHEWFGMEDVTWFGVNKILLFCALKQGQFQRAVCRTRTLTPDPTAAGTPVKLDHWKALLYDNKQDFIKSLYGKDEVAFKGDDGKWVNQLKDRRPNNQGVTFAGPIHRCWWINVAAYFHSRCIEVRLLHFTPVVDVIVAWTEMWLRIIEKVPSMSEQELIETKLKDLCPPTARAVLFDARCNNTTEDVLTGMLPLDMDHRATNHVVIKKVGDMCKMNGWVL